MRRPQTIETSDPLVTIAIPTFNRAASFLPTSLSAACNQTYRNLDILVSDNKSQDATRAVVASFADPRIRYHCHDVNIGAARNINSCIDESQGQYTVILMDDDSIDPDFVECCINAARSSPEAGLIRTGARVLDGTGAVFYVAPNLVGGLSFTQFVIGWTEGKTSPFLCSTMFRTAPLQEIGIHSRHQLWNDVMTELSIAFWYGRVDIPDIKASYCMHAGEMTVRTGIDEWCDDSLQLIDMVCSLVPADSVLLRARLTRYLATLNYRVAARLQKPWHARLAAFRTVNRVFATPPRTEAVREFAEHMPWFGALRTVKRAVYPRVSR